eukprot:1156204-Pelagomonas_calceolata.AAC.1
MIAERGGLDEQIVTLRGRPSWSTAPQIQGYLFEVTVEAVNRTAKKGTFFIFQPSTSELHCDKGGCAHLVADVVLGGQQDILGPAVSWGPFHLDSICRVPAPKLRQTSQDGQVLAGTGNELRHDEPHSAQDDLLAGRRGGDCRREGLRRGARGPRLAGVLPHGNARGT